MSAAPLLLAALVAMVAGALVLGAHRWSLGTRDLRARLDAARTPVRPSTVRFRELDDLPAPVQRFFRAALTDGQPAVAAARLRHRGTFNTGEAAERWKPFTCDQAVVARRPGFDWDARIALAPGVHVRVHDAYVAGEGLLQASLLGLFPLVEVRGTGEAAAAELMRFLAEAAWYPTALLPGQGVRWDAVDDRSAVATLGDGSVCATLLFRFDEAHLVESVHAQARGRMVKGAFVPTPWQGRFWNHAERDGMRVPLDGEVAWLLPHGARPYWRGHLAGVAYEFVR